MLRINEIRVIVFFVLSLSMLAVPPADAARPVADYQLKAVYLFHFLKFLEWPEEAVAAEAAMTICVVGDDPFFGTLDDLTTRRVKEHPIQVRYLTPAQVPDACQLLFIGDLPQPELDSVLRSLSGSTVVTVGDMRAFARRGGMIGFITRNNKIRLEINVKSLREKGVKVSSDLLDIATIVSDNGAGP